MIFIGVFSYNIKKRSKVRMMFYQLKDVKMVTSSNIFYKTSLQLYRPKMLYSFCHRNAWLECTDIKMQTTLMCFTYSTVIWKYAYSCWLFTLLVRARYFYGLVNNCAERLRDVKQLPPHMNAYNTGGITSALLILGKRKKERIRKGLGSLLASSCITISLHKRCCFIRINRNMKVLIF